MHTTPSETPSTHGRRRGSVRITVDRRDILVSTYAGRIGAFPTGVHAGPPRQNCHTGRSAAWDGAPAMSGPHDERDHSDTPGELRLRLRDLMGNDNGYVDGAWWPRTRDLAAELPALLAAVGARVGPVERVAFGLADRDAVGVRRLAGPEGRIPVEGFRSIEASTLWLVVRGRGRSRIGLMVIPAATDEERGDELLEAAGRGGERRSPSEVLAGAGAS
ncbi:hypothetical protein Acsp07_55700 [Actinomycetospora sp. NBRC 106378]|nr:hypothetical protein Acsp07_55700 [Actinomycetospora sp. NBRC 106378]